MAACFLGFGVLNQCHKPGGIWKSLENVRNPKLPTLCGLAQRPFSGRWQSAWHTDIAPIGLQVNGLSMDTDWEILGSTPLFIIVRGIVSEETKIRLWKCSERFLGCLHVRFSAMRLFWDKIHWTLGCSLSFCWEVFQKGLREGEYFLALRNR